MQEYKQLKKEIEALSHEILLANAIIQGLYVAEVDISVNRYLFAKCPGF